jgi:hypothetical protein
MAKQKLSPEAALAKARRDLRYANSRDREIKRAESQKKRREAKKNGENIEGKDYDHNTERFVSSSYNRGGTQKGGTDGTKAEKTRNA